MKVLIDTPIWSLAFRKKYILKIIKIVIEELAEVVDLYKKAIVKMDENNIFQWDEIYPNENINPFISYEHKCKSSRKD